MGEMAGLFGWIGVWGYVIALMNFFMKYVNKRYISKLSKDKQTLINTYRAVMKFIVKFHRPAGAIGTIAVVIHFYLMYSFKILSIPGLVAAISMVCVFIIGIYGVGINKNVRGTWVKIHKILSFALILLVTFHVLFTRVLLISM